MFHFGLYRHLTNGNILCDKQIIVLAYYPFIGMVIKCSSHYPFIVENPKWQPFYWINSLSGVPICYINYYLPSKWY